MRVESVAIAERLNVLFVCSRNEWRSPTAERVFASSRDLSVRSRGVSASARRRLTLADLRWADIVMVMEDEHRHRLLDQFRDSVAGVEIVVLDIPDEYRFMDPELIEMLRTAVPAVLEAFRQKKAATKADRE